MDGRFQLYKKSPFQFNDNNLILCAPQDMAGTLSAYVQSELDKLEKFYSTIDDPIPVVARPVNGDETEFYFNINYVRWVQALKNVPSGSYVRTAGSAIYNLLAELRQYNLLRYEYRPQSYNIDMDGKATTPLTDIVECFSYFYDVLQVDIVPPAAEDLEARSTDEKPGNGNTVKGYADVITFRLKVRRNKMLEAYINDDFNAGNAPKIHDGYAIEMSRERINTIRDNTAKANAYKSLSPAGTGKGFKSTYFGLFDDPNPSLSSFYVCVVGTVSQESGVQSSTEVYVAATYDDDFKATPSGASVSTVSIDAVPLAAATQISRQIKGGEEKTFPFTPYAVYVIPRGFFNFSAPATNQEKTEPGTAGKLVKMQVITPNGSKHPVVRLSGRLYRTSVSGRPVAAFETLTIGTARTRIKVRNVLQNEPTDDGNTSTYGKQTNEINYYHAETVYSYSRIVDGSRNGVRLFLNVDTAEYDITNDFSISLSAENMSAAAVQAAATQKATDFVQQGAGIVLGGAAIAGGVATGNAASIVAGVSSLAGAVSGFIQNAQREEPRQVATQTGDSDGLFNIQEFGGVYFETFQASNEAEIKFNDVYILPGVRLFRDASNTTGYDIFTVSDHSREQDYLKIVDPIISRGKGCDEDVRQLIKEKLTRGAVLCGGVETLQALTGAR